MPSWPRSTARLLPQSVGPGTAYDSINYRWHDERLADHTYLDRIVVHDAYRRRGLASLLYDEVEQGALVSLEVYVDPPNEASLAFHAARGYTEVGRLPQLNGNTCVMLVRHPSSV